jgi:hypothetical protein
VLLNFPSYKFYCAFKEIQDAIQRYIFFAAISPTRFGLKVINRRGGTVAPSAGCTMSLSYPGERDVMRLLHQIVIFFEFPLELYQPTMDGDCEKRKRLEMTQEISFPSPR